MSNDFWKGRSVFLTGHTGFKGSWLSAMLAELGAKVHGYSLAPSDARNLFELAKIQNVLASHNIGDIRNEEQLEHRLNIAQPEIIFHLAAQPLVIDSYKNPIETWSTNVLGTVNVLEASRKCKSLKAIVVITTDKVYENKEWLWGYRETERLGGKDPYSASKVCAEIAVHSYRESFFQNHECLLATARAGNIIGGGDWSLNRLVPDIVRAIEDRNVLKIRSPSSTRPWQHVLDPLSGYLVLGRRLIEGARQYATGWNFGPSEDSCQNVHYICEYAKKYFGSRLEVQYESDEPALKEARFLKLDSSKALEALGWKTKISLEKALVDTFSWHENMNANKPAADLVKVQIKEYLAH